MGGNEAGSGDPKLPNEAIIENLDGVLRRAFVHMDLDVRQVGEVREEVLGKLAIDPPE